VSARRAGILAHPTSLPGGYGVGDLGPAADEFLDWIAECGARIWQVLPLGPTGFGNSPYSGLSAFAGNPMLISPARLIDRGWLARRSAGRPPESTDRVDFESVVPWKQELLHSTWKRFRRQASRQAKRELAAFVEHADQRPWLEDWALYITLKRRHGGRAWVDWDEELRRRDPSALRTARKELASDLAFERFLQFLFFTQWSEIRQSASGRDIAILGDLPFYPAHDSADVWAHAELFLLDEAGCPTRVAGVPPDYFSRDGQLWGNPLYDWERLAERRYDWWVQRIRANLRLIDWLRLDHFRAFAAFWEVGADEKTAVNGRWVPGPGQPFFDTLREELGGLPLVAEDLGEITPDVLELRDRLGLPGMRVLQFGMDDPSSFHHPQHHVANCVVYTGTHDNDTTRGWFESLEPGQQSRLLETLQTDGPGVTWKMLETAFASVGDSAVAPLQDVLELGGEARMNTPGIATGNWGWRVDGSALTLRRAARLRSLIESTGR